MPTQQEMVEAILAIWKENEGGQAGIPDRAWAVLAAHTIVHLIKAKANPMAVQ